MENCLTYGLIFTMLERLTNMDKFDYYMEFHQMRLEDPDFAEQYDAHEFEEWYSDFYEMIKEENERNMSYEE
jgi:hypothetical protein